MMTAIASVAGYLAVLIVLGALAHRRGDRSHDGFFLAGRAVGPLLLFLTIAATNFSSFTVFGLSGAGYRIGYAYYPIMGFGTAFMALTFILIGVPVWRAGKEMGAVTPPEFIWLRLRNRPLHVAYLVVMVVFTVPYLALQPLGAGYALESIVGLPHAWGATLITVVGVGYVLAGGLRGDVWTDALQAVLMFAGLLVAFIGIAAALGGFTAANQAVFSARPELFERPGGDGMLTGGIWFSYMILWFLCDPMFPQLYQRFLAARDSGALRITAVLYPLITGSLFFFPVAIGVMGRNVLPGLSGSESDQVLPQLAERLLPSWASALVLIAGLAALMSTLDSQLLTLSSMVVRDMAGARRDPTRGLLSVRTPVIIVLALAGLALSVRPWAPILEIATETFTGLAVLFPITVASVYWRRVDARAGFASILVGEACLVLCHFDAIPTFGLLPVVPVVAATALVLVAGSLVCGRIARDAGSGGIRSGRTSGVGLAPLATVDRRAWVWAGVFFVMFVLANDYWMWNRSDRGWLGLPTWLWYHGALTLLLSALMGLMILTHGRRRTAGPP